MMAEERKADGEKTASPKPAASKSKGGGRKTEAKAKPATKKVPARKAAAKPKAEPKPKPATETPAPPPPVVRASARYVRTAPRKARLVADQVRGLHIDQARALLQFSPRSAARDIARLIDSAAANAENNHELVADDMKIAELTVDEGPTLRRYRPRALGRATRINKRTSHISVALTPDEEV
jgi:large subunit ribosomal protein L22